MSALAVKHVVREGITYTITPLGDKAEKEEAKKVTEKDAKEHRGCE